MGGEVGQGDQDGEATDEVDDQDGAFNLRKMFGQVRVEQDCESHDRVQQKGTLVTLEFVVGVV